MRHYAGAALLLLVTLGAAIGSYTINLKVSAERAAVDGLRRQLVADSRDMRNLQAELRTRARLPEMQRWNDNVLLMSAPAAGQFLRSPLQLASFGAVAAASAPAPALRYAVTSPEPVADTVIAPVTRTAYAPVDAAGAAPRPQPPSAQAPRVIRVAYAPLQLGASPPVRRAPAPLDDLAITAEARAPALSLRVAAAGSRVAGPLAARPLAARPLAAGPLAAGPLAAGPLAAGPLAAGLLANASLTDVRR